MLGDAVEQPTADAEGIVFGNREAGRVYIPSVGAAPVEVVPRAVVFRVVAPPLGLRCQCQQRAEPPEIVVGAAGAAKGSMAAIVLNDKGPHRQRTRRNAKRKHWPAAEG